MIEIGNTIEVHYTGKFEDGEIFDSSIDRTPLKFEVGSGQLIKGFDESVLNKNVGDKFTVNISPSDGYGESIETMIVEINKDQVPEGIEVGQSLQAIAQNGNPINVIVEKIEGDKVTINANHPLAGKNLIFDIEILKIYE